jgi:hypothetical protein
MNIFNSFLTFLEDFWHLLEEFVEHMHPQFLQYDEENK